MKYGLPELLLLKGFHAQVDKNKCTRGHNLIDLTPSQTPEANGATLSTCPCLHPPSPFSSPDLIPKGSPAEPQALALNCL